MSAKRAKSIGVAAVGTLAVAGAVCATALSPGAAAASASTVAAHVTVAGSHQGVATARPADAMDASQRVAQFDRVRFGLQHQTELTDAKAAAAKAAAAKAAAAKAGAAKAAARAASATRPAPARTQTVAAQRASEPSGSPQQLAEQMLGQFGWPGSQFSCLEPLWEHESGWNVTAENPSSGAYGIPQALSGSLMASSGPDWQTNAATQIRWGLTYIQGRYGSPCGAWAHEEADNWY